MDAWTIVSLLSGLVVGAAGVYLVLRGQLRATQSQSRELSAGMAALTQSAEAAQQTAAAAQNERDRATSQAELLEKQRGDLELQVGQLTEDFEAANTQIGTLAAKVEGLNVTVGTLQESLAQTQGERDTAQSDLEQAQGELEAARSELETAQSDLDTAKDDLYDEKGRADDAEASLEEMRSDLQAAQEKNLTLAQNLRSARSDLDAKAWSLERKTTTLDLVQQILCAEEVDTSGNATEQQLQDFHAMLDNDFADLDARLRESRKAWFRADGAALAREFSKQDGLDWGGYTYDYWLDQYRRWAATKRKRWLDGKRKVAFIGEFSAGKTSIVNSLIAGNLPCETKPTTSIPTYVTCPDEPGDGDQYLFVSRDGKLNMTDKEFVKQFGKEAFAELPEAALLIKHLILYKDNPELQGLSILDTPGFSSNDELDTQRTMSVINECDALFWVMDVQTGGLNQSSIRIIKKSDLRLPLFLVINKVDTKSAGEVDDVESLVAQTLKRESIPYNSILRYSNKQPPASLLEATKGIVSVDNSQFLTSFGLALEAMVARIEAEREELYKQLDTVKDDESGLLDEIQATTLQFRNHKGIVERMPRPDSSGILLWKENFYKLTEAQYDDFQSKLEAITNDMDAIKTKSDSLLDLAKEHWQRKLALDATERDLKAAEKCLCKFKELSKSISIKQIRG